MSSDDGNPLDLTKLRDIHFGRLLWDLNVCAGETAHYYHPVNNTAPDLSSNYVLIQLDPNEGDFFGSLNLTMAVLNTTKDLDPHEIQLA